MLKTYTNFTMKNRTKVLKKKIGVGLKNPKTSKSRVRRSLWQALLENYKKLSADMKIITKEGMSFEKIKLIEKYREQYERGDKLARELYEFIKKKSKQAKTKTK